MKWISAHHGITLLAETDEDDRILDDLVAALPKTPEKVYEKGDFEADRKNKRKAIYISR